MARANGELICAAASDALAYFASREAIDRAADALDRGEFAAWSAEVQRGAARELRALGEAYKDVTREAVG